ncbi:MAG TPA: hypothetical protein VM142_12115 [Acidimicrobiales bacterium]|nr:hypothetical protein [Acidimicrobiales bacterium]
MDDMWRLSGECMVGFARRPRGWRSALPSALSPLFGPIAVIGVRYDVSPVGPYIELSVAEPARLGLRTGLCVTTMAVTSPAARALCRQRWELPTEVAAMTWSGDSEERSLVWEEREIVLRGRPRGPWLPVILPLRSLQGGPSGPVVAPRRMRGRLRMAAVVVEAPEGDRLATLAGRHPGVMSGALSMVAHPPRRPTGLFSSIPLRVPNLAPGPEPAGLTATMAELRAYGSVG